MAPITKTTAENGVIVDRPDLMGLRDRALIGLSLMAYSFARVGERWSGHDRGYHTGGIDAGGNRTGASI
jgi:hypothetical protein